jgi:hypothetical protein
MLGLNLYTSLLAGFAIMKQAWIVTVDMGYGHQRAAYPFADIAYERILNANSDKNNTWREQRMWRRFQMAYEGISRLRSVPFVGEPLWRGFDRLQSISPYYPHRDLSNPNFGALFLDRLISKGFLRSVVEHTKRKNLPFVSTYFATAVAAAKLGHKDVCCIVTDTDISRVWVPKQPKQKLNYFTPSEWAAKRLEAYGVPRDRIFFTGFPLPKENTGADMQILKENLASRLLALDPQLKYLKKHRQFIEFQLGKKLKNPKRPLTLTYAVGGAGAQKEVGGLLIRSLKRKIMARKLHLNLVAGTRLGIDQYFREQVKLNGLRLGQGVDVVFSLDKRGYFRAFCKLLQHTDILWTKPSELVFYSALGLPIVISPPLGSHEIMNQKWLRYMGLGFPMEAPEYAHEWLFEWLNRGILAEAAWEGFLKAPKYGTYNIEKLIFARKKTNVKLRF